MTNRSLLGGVLIAAWILGVTSAAYGQEETLEGPHLMHLVTQSGLPILRTGLSLQVGDRFIDSENNDWHVGAVVGSRAVATPIGTAGIKLTPREWRLVGRTLSTVRAAVVGGAPADVVVYHTHSDESYIPGDGTDSIDGQGGIYRVGSSLVNRLNVLGVHALQRIENHNPRDQGAYIRSRRTAITALTEQQPQLLLDLHRDAAPRSEYQFTIDQESVARAMIVIGGSNPAHEGNLAFAKLMKQQADLAYPGLVKGIYIGRGNYNQDTSTRNILVEIGSQETPRIEAERTGAYLAAAIVPLVRQVQVPASPAVQTENRAAWHNMGWLIGAVIMVALGGLVLNSGGLRPALSRLTHWQRALRNRRKGG